MGPGGCPAWGHAPAGRQAAGRGWAVQPQPAGCAPAPHSTRMSHEERPAAGHGPSRASSGASGSSGPQGCPGCPGRRMLSHPHHCAGPLRSSVQPLLGLVAAEAVHKAAQQLVPAVPTAGKSTFPGEQNRGPCLAPAAGCRLMAVPHAGVLFVPQRRGCAGSLGRPSCLGSLCPNSPHPANPNTPTPNLRAAVPTGAGGSPGCHPRGSVCGRGWPQGHCHPPVDPGACSSQRQQPHLCSLVRLMAPLWGWRGFSSPPLPFSTAAGTGWNPHLPPGAPTRGWSEPPPVLLILI